MAVEASAYKLFGSYAVVSLLLLELHECHSPSLSLSLSLLCCITAVYKDLRTHELCHGGLPRLSDWSMQTLTHCRSQSFSCLKPCFADYNFDEIFDLDFVRIVDIKIA